MERGGRMVGILLAACFPAPGGRSEDVVNPARRTSMARLMFSCPVRRQSPRQEEGPARRLPQAENRRADFELPLKMLYQLAR
jgi:hypothetical protein